MAKHPNHKTIGQDSRHRWLTKYRVGLAWYSGGSENFTSGISNKIFEYLHCGLQAVFSHDMAEAKEHLLTGYDNPMSFVDFKSEDWIQALGKRFQQNQWTNRKLHSKLCSEPLLNWIKNGLEERL